MITVNNVEVKTQQCGEFKHQVPVNDNVFFSNKPIDISGNIEVIDYKTRTGTIFKTKRKNVAKLAAVNIVSDDVLPFNVNDSVPEKLTEIAEYLNCFILNPEAFDGRYVLIGVDENDKPGSSYFTVSSVKLAAFYVTTDFKPSPIRDEHIKMLIDQLPGLDIMKSFIGIEN